MKIQRTTLAISDVEDSVGIDIEARVAVYLVAVRRRVRVAIRHKLIHFYDHGTTTTCTNEAQINAIVDCSNNIVDDQGKTTLD